MKIIKELTNENLKEIKEVIARDGIIIFPTDTVYGIGCNCMSEEAIKKLFSIKKRDYSKPINVLTDTREKINKVAQNISEKEKQLIEKYMPGDLTIILNKKESVPSILTANLETIGVRIPNNEVALKILSMSEYPLATTSANISGKDAGIKLDDFLTEFQDKVDIIVDIGEPVLKVASTIVRVENDEIKILRQGNLIVDLF